MNNKNEAPLNALNSERAYTENHNKIKDFPMMLKDEISSKQEYFDENHSTSNENTDFFNVMSANEWIKKAELRPIPKMLFSEFWYEGEVCILYADTNLGKSILAVNIADSISKGIPINGFKLEAEKQKVLYFDFELTDKQFQNRYSENYKNSYKFSDNLIRIEINPNSEIPDDMGFEQYLNISIEDVVIRTSAKVVIIDNITYLRSETEKANQALPLMKQLKALKNKHNLSLLILAHTPKRDLSKLITKNDLQGSKMLINFCDSAFAIGESFSNKDVRYIKMIKARSTEIFYDSDHIIECQIHKPSNFLVFEFLNFGKEIQHLKVPSEKDKEELQNQILQILQDEPKATSYSIAKRLCKDETKFPSFKVKVHRIYVKLKDNL